MKCYTLVSKTQVPVGIIYNVPLDQVFDIIFRKAIRDSGYTKLREYKEILNSIKHYSELGIFFYSIGYYILEADDNYIGEADIDLEEFYNWFCNILDEEMKPLTKQSL